MESKVKWIANFKLEHALKTFLKERGIPRASIQEVKEHFNGRSGRRASKDEFYFVYSGPLDEKTRPFCKQLLTLDKVISETDIDILSNYLNYDVKLYKGSYNCRHKFRRFRGEFILTPELTITQIRSLVNKGIKG